MSPPKLSPTKPATDNSPGKYQFLGFFPLDNITIEKTVSQPPSPRTPERANGGSKEEEEDGLRISGEWATGIRLGCQSSMCSLS